MTGSISVNFLLRSLRPRVLFSARIGSQSDWRIRILMMKSIQYRFREHDESPRYKMSRLLRVEYSSLCWRVGHAGSQHL